jgi:MoxR-like ATPase
MENIKTIAQKLGSIEKELAQFHIEREAEIHGMMLAWSSRQHILYIGDPGLGKTQLAMDAFKHISSARTFTHLMGQFTVPDEIAGAPSLKDLENDIYRRNTTNMLPEAHFAFLDEVFKCNSATLNFLLMLINEGKFNNGGELVDAPLNTLVGASNEIPEREDGLDAFYDRFPLKYNVDAVKETANRMRVMDSFLNRKDEEPQTIITLDELQVMQNHVAEVHVPISCRKTLLDLARDLEKEHIYVSTRSINKTLRLIQAEALLDGRMEAIEDDLAICRHSFWREPEHEKIIYAKILSRISPDKNALESLMAEAEEIYQEFTETEVNDENAPKFLQYAQSLTKLKEKMESLRINIREKGKPTKDADKFVSTVSNYVRETLRNGIGIDAE